MYFNFDDNHPDVPHVGEIEPGHDRIVLSIPASAPHVALFTILTLVFHVLAVLVILNLPNLDADRRRRVAELVALQQQREREQTRFVFVQPHLDMPATRPPSARAEASDKDRNAQARQRAPNPTNSLPFSVGNTAERVEALKSPPPSPPQPAPQPSTPAGQNDPANGQAATTPPGSPPPAPSSSALMLPGMRSAGTGRVPDAPAATGTGGGRGGLLGSAMRDLQRMVQQDAFDNRGGGAGVFGPSIQFDTKGVEFGPWIRRFIAQIKRNWLIPQAAMAMKGHVAIQFYVWKDGRITELGVPGPCDVEAFNRAAYNALATSNPTYPLPQEYPSEKAFFTVIFYYNETPPGGGYQ